MEMKKTGDVLLNEESASQRDSFATTKDGPPAASKVTKKLVVGIVILVVLFVVILAVIVAGRGKENKDTAREYVELELGAVDYISSNDYPKPAPGEETTYSTVFETQLTNYVIRFEFTLFHMDGLSSLLIDDVDPTTNVTSNLAAFRSGDRPTTLFSTSNKVALTFSRSSEDDGVEFSAKIYVTRKGALPAVSCDPVTEWACLDGVTCIPLDQRCDNATDCPMYGEDEEACDVCGHGHFRCGDGKCIPKYMLCDHSQQCLGNEDEALCPFTFTGSCPATHFTCDDGDCVYRDRLCDHRYDCRDNSDESPELCGTCNPKTEVTCDDGSCKSIIYARCNMRGDCSGMADEVNCSGYHGTPVEFIELGLYQSVNITSSDWPQPGHQKARFAWTFSTSI
ncbi:uncharacterized protein [Diadema antillarum]|uniref:uncharacterized protein n=1 Tax=Diadema antillarum TaxID=105358 RepID=UPI003A88BFF1